MKYVDSVKERIMEEVRDCNDCKYIIRNFEGNGKIWSRWSRKFK